MSIGATMKQFKTSAFQTRVTGCMGKEQSHRQDRFKQRPDAAEFGSDVRHSSRCQTNFPNESEKNHAASKQRTDLTARRLQDSAELTKFRNRTTVTLQSAEKAVKKEKKGDSWHDPLSSLHRVAAPSDKTANPLYGVSSSAASNRFGIAPGVEWDGVDRSNGFESKVFAHMHASSTAQQEAYEWRSADM